MTQTIFALLLWLGGPAALTISGEGFPVAPVLVNGTGPHLLVVDTAAGATSLFPHLAETLRLDPEHAREVSVQGASGVRQVALHRIGPVEAAGARVESLSAVVIDATHLFAEGQTELSGILGADFLSAFDVEMDFFAGTLQLAAPAPTAPSGAVPFESLFGRFLLIPVRVDGAELTAVVDTGARRSLLNRHAAKAAGLGPGDERLELDEPVRGATTDTTPAWTFRAKTLEAAGVRWESPLLGVSDLPVFAALGLADKPAMILGVNLLTDRRLRIDYDEKRLLISAPAPAPEPGPAVLPASP